MLRRLAPRSLAGQLMLVLALALVLAQAINLGLLVRAAGAERLASIASGAAAQIADASERLSTGLPPGASRTLRPQFGQPNGPDGPDRPERGERMRRVVVADQPRFRPGMQPWPEVAERVDEVLQEGGVEVRAVRAARMALPLRGGQVGRRERGMMVVAVAAQLPDGRWITVRSRGPAAQPAIAGLLTVQTVILFVLLIAPLLWVGWRVSRPLKQLARAATDLRPGAERAPVPESGPEDVRELTRAFNHMQQRISAMLAEKDHMLGAVGHDLRTPLASLRVRVEQVGDEALRQRMAATIAEMATMLDDILSLARAGQPSEPSEPTDLAALVDGLVADYRAMGRAVDLAGDGVVPTHMLRPASLRRAVRNLIDNALAYGGSATVGLAVDAAGATRLSVADRGPGIPADRIAEMMEPFARAESSRNRNTGGSGLGLALAKALVLAEGGRLELANREGGGLVATITLGAADRKA